MISTGQRGSTAMSQSGTAQRLAVLLAALAAAFSGTAAAAAEKVTYLLPAPAFLPAFGPWMLAKQRGYFEKEGLDVDFEAAKGGADAAKQVGAGNAVIGGAIGDTPIIVRANGVPVKAGRAAWAAAA